MTNDLNNTIDINARILHIRNYIRAAANLRVSVVSKCDILDAIMKAELSLD